MFSALTVGYLFLGGAGAGACAVLSVLELATARQHAGGRTLAARARAGECVPSLGARMALNLALPTEFFARAWPACLLLLAMGIACLVADVGRPDRLLALFASPHLTPLSIGTYALACSLACAVAFSCFSLLDTLAPARAVTLALSLLGVVFGAVAAAYTGVLLQMLASVLAYQTLLLPLLFLLSSLSCGLGVAFASFAFVESRYPHTRALVSLARADSAVLVLEALCVAAFAGRLAADAGTRLSAHALVMGDLSGSFWCGVVLVGLVVPFALEWFAAQGGEGHRTQLLWAAACVLAGGVALRLCVAGLAAFDVTQMPGMMFGLAG